MISHKMGHDERLSIQIMYNIKSIYICGIITDDTSIGNFTKYATGNTIKDAIINFNNNYKYINTDRIEIC